MVLTFGGDVTNSRLDKKSNMCTYSNFLTYKSTNWRTYTSQNWSVHRSAFRHYLISLNENSSSTSLRIWHYKRAYYESTLSLQGLSYSTQIFARPRTSSWHCILNLWQWLSQIFRKNVYVIFFQAALMNFQRVTGTFLLAWRLLLTNSKGPW